MFIADDRPYGLIECSVGRDDAPDAGRAWYTIPGFTSRPAPGGEEGGAGDQPGLWSSALLAVTMVRQGPNIHRRGCPSCPVSPP